MFCIRCGKTCGEHGQFCEECLSSVECKPKPIESHFSFLSVHRNSLLSLFLGSVLVCILFQYGLFYSGTRRHPPGIIAPNTPKQFEVDLKKQWTKGEYSIRALAGFHIEARAVLTSHFYFTDGADISPLDITFAWGPLSDQRVLDRLTLTHGGRMYSWRGSNPLPMKSSDINRHMANMHLVPASDSVEEQLLSVREGDVVAIHGYLIAMEGPDGYHWKSSLTREDSGNGACELVWVDDVRVRT